MLSKKTKGILEGKISTYTEKNAFYTSFYIVAPELDNYRCTLMRMVSGATLYPVYLCGYSEPENYHDGIEVKLPGTNSDEMPLASYVAFDYDELEETVKQILSSKETADIIHSLMSQSQPLLPTSPF